jgi:DNA invertase Pin-like site-specific DNA recombinase
MDIKDTVSAPDGHMIGYMRVSTSEQDFALQRNALVKFGIPASRIYSDVMTGSKMDRVGLRRAIKRCWGGDTLVVWKLDRLGRSTIGVLQQIDELAKAGIRLISVTENIDTESPHGRFMITIIAAFAQMERDLISERTKAGVKAFVERGGRMGPPHPVLDNPKRLAKFDDLMGLGQIAVKGGEGGLSAPAIVALLNEADKTRGLKPISVHSYNNWKAKDFKGYQLPYEDIVKVNDEQ